MPIEMDASRNEDESEPLDSEFPETEDKNATVSVPATIRDDGMYAITLAQAEMYDLGNIAFVNHYILLDRKTRTGIDTTAIIDQAELLSAVPDGQVVSADGIDNLDSWLTGKTAPKYNDYPQGVNQFIAVEIAPEKAELLRAAMVEVAKRRIEFDTAVKVLNSEVAGVRELFNTESRGEPE